MARRSHFFACVRPSKVRLVQVNLCPYISFNGLRTAKTGLKPLSLNFQRQSLGGSVPLLVSDYLIGA